MPTLSPNSSLRAIKLLHSLVWALFASCIVAIPICVVMRRIDAAALLVAVVFLEVVVLVVNGGRCPLTNIAARFTDDRKDNFDIYLPLWIARHNKLIFGTLYLAGIALTLAEWARLRSLE
ncbi:MAG: hypothetical protein WC538_24065 [Thermoanaerobaculia bacterium]|jgi:hypothetical protein